MVPFEKSVSILFDLVYVLKVNLHFRPVLVSAQDDHMNVMVFCVAVLDCVPLKI